MLYNVEKQIQEAMERGGFENLPGKGKRQRLEGNPFVPHEARIINGMLKDIDLAPRWIEVGKEIRAEREQAEQLLESTRRRRGRLKAAVRAQPLKHDAVRQAFELERKRALEIYTRQLKGLNQKILRYNLTVPARNRQKPMYNHDAAIAHFRKECPCI